MQRPDDARLPIVCSLSNGVRMSERKHVMSYLTSTLSL
jgi:hypothetical protein